MGRHFVLLPFQLLLKSFPAPILGARIAGWEMSLQPSFSAAFCPLFVLGSTFWLAIFHFGSPFGGVLGHCWPLLGFRRVLKPFCVFLFGRPNWAARLRFWVTFVSHSILAAFSRLFSFSFWAPKMPVSVYNNICTCPGQHKRTPNIVRGKGVGALLYECEGFF